MTDLSGVDPNPNPDPANYIIGQRRAAQGAAVAALDANPDDAARAMQLAEATGTHPTLVDANLEDFERQHKAALTSHLLNNNPYLRDYVNSHPLAAKVSNDDMGQLDELSQHLVESQKTIFDKNWDVLKAFATGAAEHAEGPLTEAARRDFPNFSKNNPFLMRTMDALQAPFDIAGRTASAGFGAVEKGIAELFSKATGDEDAGRRFAGELMIFPQVAFQEFTGPHVPHELNAAARQAQKATRAAAPFLKAGVDPPHGIDPLIDELYTRQAEADGEALDRAQKLAGQSATRERNPEMFSRFVQQHTDARLGISAEAIRSLYGESEPKPDDGKLGWIPDLGDKLRIAEAGGGDVEVPLASWLAHVEPDIARELHDDVRVRRGGVTLREAAERGEQGGEGAQAEVRPSEDLAGEPLAQEEPPARKTAEQEMIEFAEKNNLPPPTTEQVIKNLKTQIRQVQYDRSLARKAGEDVTTEDWAATRNKLKRLRDELKLKEQPEVESLRRGAALEPKAEELARDFEHEAFIDDVTSPGQWMDFHGSRVYIKPTELWTQHELAIGEKVNAEFERLGLKGVDLAGVHSAEVRPGHRVSGIYHQFTQQRPLILWALTSDDAVGSVRHEGIHHLRQGGFFTPEEWTTLKAAAVKGEWIQKHRITERYPNKGLGLHFEEAIAEEFSEWARNKQDAGPLQPIFEKLKALTIAIKSAIKEVLGYDPSVEELFQKIESGEVGAREPKGPLDPRAFREPLAQEERGGQFEMEDMTRMNDRELFGRRVFEGLPKKYYDRWMELINKRDQEDTEYAAKKAEKDIARRETREWKDQAGKIREEVKANLANRPDVAADEFLRTGTLHGEKLQGRPRLDASKLTDEQKAALPKDYYTDKGGLLPDDAAGLFGYPSGEAMIERIAALNADRGELGPKEYLNRLTETEVERRMQNEFGDLNERVLEEAKDHVISQTQMDILHQEVLGLGMRAGVIDPDAGLTISRADMQRWVKEQFDKQPISIHDSQKYMKDAGRAGNKAINALVTDDPKEAFKFKQQQQIAMLMAREAAGMEKTQKGLDRIFKQFRSREVGSASQEYTNWIHDIMTRVGQPVRRSVQDIYEQAGRDGYHSLNEFVESKSAQLRDLYVPDFLRDPNFRKAFEDLTGGEFFEVNKAIRAMVHNARDELKVVKEGEKAELKDVLAQMREKTATLGDKQYPIDRKPSTIAEQAKSWWWSAITVESMLNRLDRDMFSGLFNQYIVREFTSASNYRDRLIREYQTKIAKVGKIKGMDDLVENNIFKDPISGEPFILRRRNLLGILQNAGNLNNLTKLAEGYGLKPEQVMQWLHERTTKEDWDRAQKIGDLFEEIFEKANQMSHNVSGVGIERLPLEGLQTPHGEYRGWYNPIKYDSLRPGESRRLIGSDIEAEGYYRATTPQGYTQKRTGYIAPVQLDMDVVPIRMQQMLHDIAVRPAVLQLSKFFYNPEFKKMMINHYGRHQAEAFIPFLRDFANASNFKSLAEQMGNSALEYLRQNTIANLIGFNPGTVMKHGITAAVNSLHEVGVIPWFREFANIAKDLPAGQENWRMAMEKSEELQRRMRNYSEIIQGHGSEINIRGTKKHSNFQSLRELVIAAGATPVSISDLLSAVPTWLASYKGQIAEGATEGTAVSFADRSVRRAHGSSVLTNRPEIARSNALGAWFTSLYGFFSHMQQKQYELAWKAKDLYKDTFGQGSGDAESTARHAMPLLKGLMAYVVIPAMVEEMVTPYTNSEKESWGLKAAKTFALGISSSFIGVRDFVHAAINLRDPQAGLAATSMSTASNLIRDLAHGGKAFTKEKAGNLIRHTISLTGVLTGLTNETEAKAAKFLFNWNSGLEHPRWISDWGTGLRHGTMKKPR